MKSLFILAFTLLLSSTFVMAQSSKPKTDTTKQQMYTCTMHPEVVRSKPGKCPQCGMTLVPVKKVQAKTYTCPMHPEVVSNKPGKCPKCGMELVEKTGVKHTDTAKHKMQM